MKVKTLNNFFTFIILLILISCASKKELKYTFYKSAYEFILEENENEKFFVSDSIYFMNYSDFAKIQPYNSENEKLIEKYESKDKANNFKTFKNRYLHNEINYKIPEKSNTSILFFSKPVNDTLVCELFNKYQNSNSLKDYYYFGASKLYMFKFKNNEIELIQSFIKSR